MRKLGHDERQLLEVGLLIVGIVLGVALAAWHPWRQGRPTFDDSLLSFYDSTNWKRRSDWHDWPRWERHEKPSERFPFNPNRVDSASLLRMGYTPGQVGGIMNYRRRGGVYHTADDFNRFGWRTREDWVEIRPFVHIDSADFAFTRYEHHDYPQKRDTILDLNTADTTELKLLRGISSGYAGIIVRRRESLGGYATIEQLKEILPEATYEQVREQFTVSRQEIKTIPVNQSSIGRLKMHPYLTFEQARALYELRRRQIRLNSLDELRSLPEFTSSDLSRLEPYLDFR